MSDLFYLTTDQLERINPYFPLSHGVAHVDDRKVDSGIIYVIKNGLMWKNTPLDYGPYKTLYNRFSRWSNMGIFSKIFSELANNAEHDQRLMIDATHLKAHRTAASVLKKELFPDVSSAPGGLELQTPRRLRRPWKTGGYVSDGRSDQGFKKCGQIMG